MTYNWQQNDWPNFHYEINVLQEKLYLYAEAIGRLDGRLHHLPEKSQMDIALQLMVSEAIKTSEIEGEYVSRADVLSSIKRQLGLSTATSAVKDNRAEGISLLMGDLRNHFDKPLSKSLLHQWHQNLFTGQTHSTLKIGAYRTHAEPMQVISGPYGKVTVHFEAPPSKAIAKMMTAFIQWFNSTQPGKKHAIDAAPIRAAIAHLYFVNIHPFEDGNGRIARALSEKTLSQGFQQAVPLSISTCIEPKRKQYYAALKKAQSTNEITPWLTYFLDMLLETQLLAEKLITFTLQKTKFFDQHDQKLNPRQRKAIQKMLNAGPDGFEGGMTARKYTAMTRCSKATATRDLADLVDKNVLRQLPGGGRNTHYEVKL